MYCGTVLHTERRGGSSKLVVLRWQILIASRTRGDPLFSASGNGVEGAVGVANLFTAIILFFKGVFTVIEHAILTQFSFRD